MKVKIPFILSILTITLFGLIAWAEFRLGGYQKITQIWLLDNQPYFQDLKVLINGLDFIRKGESPYQNATPFNYPIGWGVFSFIPWINIKNLKIIGCLQAVSFFFVCIYIFKKEKVPQIPAALVMFSPAVLLMVERGNCDLIIFLLLACTTLFVKSPTFSLATTLILSLLKIYPFGSVFGWLMKENKSLWFKPEKLVIFSVFLAGLLASYRSYFYVSERTPRPYHYMSYGLGTLPQLAAERFGFEKNEYFPLLICFYVLIFLIIVFFCLKKSKTNMYLSNNEEPANQLFYAGAGCFLASNIIGFNWEYRLSFLLLCLPFIFLKIKNRKKEMIIWYVCIVLLCWQTFLKKLIDMFIFKMPYKTNHFYLFADIINIFLFISLSCYFLQAFLAKCLDKKVCLGKN